MINDAKEGPRDTPLNPSYERIILNLPVDSSLAIPLLRDFAAPPGTVLRERLERRYRRLSFVQEELDRLNSLKKESDAPARNDPAEGGGRGFQVSFEDFVFSNTDFSRYKKIPEKDFNFFIQGINDFDSVFFLRNFGIESAEAESAVRKNYKKNGSFYCLERMSPLVLSLLRTLETSLESSPLVKEEEILEELKRLYDFMNARRVPQSIGPFFRFLLYRLDGLLIIHGDGKQTKLFMDSRGSLCGTFKPCDKPWTFDLVKTKGTSKNF